MHERARARVREYIRLQVAEAHQADVHRRVQQGYPEIHLQDFDVVVSDGFRPPPNVRAPSPSHFQQNISTLMAMNLADAIRAQQVLEATSNNLEQAVAMLLALADADMHQ
jgi:hypothetical protein